MIQRYSRQEDAMTLWLHWWNAIALLRPAFSRLRSFLWFLTAVAGLTVRPELLGVTSIVRALSLKPVFYDRLLDHFHSASVKPDALGALWTRLVLRLFPAPVRVNGRLVVVGDGIKAAKRGKKMPGVKLLHQQSDSNKAEYIMGHSLQAICLLVQAAETVFAVPLAMRIHEGIVWSNRDQRTLLDKMLALLGLVGIAEAFYFVGDAYYASGKIVNGLLEQNITLSPVPAPTLSPIGSSCHGKGQSAAVGRKSTGKRSASKRSFAIRLGSRK